MRIVYLLLILCLFVPVVQAQEKADVFRAGDNTLFATPTGETVPAGTHQLSSYQLLFLGYSYGINDRLQVGAFSFFPISAEIVRQSFFVGVKYEIIRSGPISVAGSASLLPAGGVVLGLATATYRMDDLRLHGGLGTGLEFDSDASSGAIVMFGADYALNERTKVMGEFISIGGGVFDDASGVYNVGFRFLRGDINVDLGGMRPLGVEGSFLFFPFVKASIVL